MPKVAVIIGSASDKDIIRPCLETLEALQIDFSATISSAHRTPERTADLVAKAETAGAGVFICAAGMAAHLAGAVAARTIRPVIGLPVAGSALCGMDALFSTVEMPSGFPVATVALNGAKNAALLAAQILALQDSSLAERLRRERAKMRTDVEKAALEMENSIQPNK